MRAPVRVEASACTTRYEYHYKALSKVMNRTQSDYAYYIAVKHSPSLLYTLGATLQLLHAQTFSAFVLDLD